MYKTGAFLQIDVILAHEFVMIGCFVAEFIIFIEIQNFVLVTLKTINVWSPYNLSSTNVRKIIKQK
jgi:hypothetical protein